MGARVVAPFPITFYKNKIYTAIEFIQEHHTHGNLDMDDVSEFLECLLKAGYFLHKHGVTQPGWANRKNLVGGLGFIQVEEIIISGGNIRKVGQSQSTQLSILNGPYDLSIGVGRYTARNSKAIVSIYDKRRKIVGLHGIHIPSGFLDKENLPMYLNNPILKVYAEEVLKGVLYHDY